MKDGHFIWCFQIDDTAVLLEEVYLGLTIKTHMMEINIELLTTEGRGIQHRLKTSLSGQSVQAS